jgi:hypothetical protein
LRGKAEASGDERRLDLGLGQSCDQGAALKPLFQRPGGVLGIPRLDDENERGVEAERAKARPIRTPPFKRNVPREAPQHEVAALSPRRLRDHGKSEGKGGRAIAVGGPPDLVEAPFPQLAQREFFLFLPPERVSRHARI